LNRFGRSEKETSTMSERKELEIQKELEELAMEVDSFSIQKTNNPQVR
jgi:hypothetical protein